MGYLLGSTTIEIFCALILVLWVIYKKLTQPYSYWTDRRVPSIKPVFPLGSIWDMFLGRMQIGQMYQKYYEQFKGERYFGVHEALKPSLVVRDPELVKHVLIKDFQSFNNRLLIPIDKENDYISVNLFNMVDQEWRNMRMKLIPTFSSGKLKTMFVLMEKCGEQLKDFLADHIKTQPAVDIKDCLARFTMDIIATCAFGLEINSLTDRNCEFYKVGMKIFEPSLIGLAQRFLLMSLSFCPKILLPRIVPKDISEFFTKIVRDTVEYREKNSVNRNDFLNLLIKVRQNKSLQDEEELDQKSELDTLAADKKSGLSIKEIAGHSFIFFAAGFETASSTMTFCLYELALNPEVQEKLHQEIKEVLAKNGGKPTYQALQEMTYLDQVVNETLRRYSSVSVLFRICNETYKVPDSDLVLEKGQRVLIPIYAIHHDPEYYPDPYKFDPERFSAEKVKERHQYVHLPFGEGPRMCIGMRFGLLQTKIGLTELLSTFKFGLTPETPLRITLHKRSFLTQPDKPIHLSVTQRNS